MEDIKSTILRMSAEADKGWGELYYHVIPNLIKERGYKKVLEIGVAWAGHAVKIIESGAEYTGVDEYKCYSNGFSDNGKDFTQAHYNELYDYAFKRVVTASGTSNLIRESSTEYLNDLIGLTLNTRKKFDLIFIDANHEYDWVKNEIELAWQLVKKGGALTGHDYNPEGFPGVCRAVEEFAKKKNLPFKVLDGYVWQIDKC